MALYDHRMLSLDDRITMGELLLVNGVAMSSPVTGTVADRSAISDAPPSNASSNASQSAPQSSPQGRPWRSAGSPAPEREPPSGRTHGRASYGAPKSLRDRDGQSPHPAETARGDLPEHVTMD